MEQLLPTSRVITVTSAAGAGGGIVGDDGNNTTTACRRRSIASTTAFATAHHHYHLTVQTGTTAEACSVSSSLTPKCKAAVSPMAKRKKPRRRRRRLSGGGDSDYDDKEGEDEDDPPFFLLVVQVGMTLAVVCLGLWFLYRRAVPASSATSQEGPIVPLDDDDNVMSSSQPVRIGSPDSAAAGSGAAARAGGGGRSKGQNEQNEEPPPPPLPIMPGWNLTDYAVQFDAFAVAERYGVPPGERDKAALELDRGGIDLDLFWASAAGLRSEFVEAYGGGNETAARAIADAGVIRFGRAGTAESEEGGGDHSGRPSRPLPKDLQHTACRIQRALQENRPFRFSFGGYSVTAGRGNYLHQAFPAVLEAKLLTVFSMLGATLEVRNAAIGGCPSFPYGWCMNNFWHDRSDVVSWDYAMNEAGGDPIGLEAYARHAMQMEERPKLIVMDTDAGDGDRRELLRRYAERDLLPDTVVLNAGSAARPYLDLPEPVRPSGFREWRKFGAPPGAPGQALHHPAMKEHAFMAWLLTMHFLSALELVAADSQAPVLKCPPREPATRTVVDLPKPLTSPKRASDQPWNSILFGEEDPQNRGSWRMNPVHCQTSFEPILSGNLSSVVVSGATAEDMDAMLPKSKMFYNRGWVLDLSDGEKQAKRKLDRFGGLGFIDSKKAYYGLYSSGTLRLLVPYQLGQAASDSGAGVLPPTLPRSGDRALDWFKAVVVCEVNEKREGGACNAARGDVRYTVGGANAMAASIDAAGTLYLGRRLCVYLPVPEAARLSTRRELSETATTLHHREETDQHQRQVFQLPKERSDPQTENRVGLAVEILVENMHINKRELACSVSHVVWEQQHQHRGETTEDEKKNS